MTFGPGNRVLHPNHGPGAVLALVAGYRVRVRFDRSPSLPLTVPRQSLVPFRTDGAGPANGRAGPKPPRAWSGHASHGGRRNRRAGGPASGSGRSKEVAAPTRPAPAGHPRDWADLWQTIEALRLGVVPSAHAKDYTVGRERELKRLEEVLDSGQGLRIVLGDYGLGKTHLLDVLEQVALKRGYVISRVVLDPNEVPLSHPLRLYRAILSGLRYPEGAGGTLDPILQPLEESRPHHEFMGRRYSRFFTPVLFGRRARDPEIADWLQDYIEGCRLDAPTVDHVLRRIGWRGDRILVLSDFRTYGRMYVHLLGTLASWARDAGFRGLLVLFDEVERTDVFDAKHLDLAMEVLGHYAAVALPSEVLKFDPDDLYKGGHAVHQNLPLRFEENQPLGVVIALTDAPRTKERILALLDSGAVLVPLERLPRKALGTLVDRVIDLYARAYPGYRMPVVRRVAIREQVLAAWPGGDQALPREIVRGTVGLLDAGRHGRADLPGTDRG